MKALQEQRMFDKEAIKAIIGLGNPGSRFIFTRHNIGFLILDELACQGASVSSWQSQERAMYLKFNEKILIKPQTFMNNSGKIFPFLQKKGIKPEQILVIHDELEKPFGHMSIRFGGSARGHNGLRSFIEFVGSDFWRFRFGIGRPERKEEVADYVLTSFSLGEKQELPALIAKAGGMII